LKKLQEEEHPPWWKQLVDIITKYVAPILMCIVAGVIFGPAAGVISAMIFLATSVPVKDQQSLVSLMTSGIVNGLAKDFGWSAGVTAIVQGVFNVVVAVILAYATGGAASSAVAEEALANAADSTLESAESTVANNAGKFMAFNTFSSVTASTNCWYDIAFGSWQMQNGQNDQDKGELIATVFNAVMTFITTIASLGACGKISFDTIQEGATNITESLGKASTTTILKVLNTMNNCAVAAKVGSSVDQAFESQETAALNSEITKQRGQIQLWEGFTQISSGTSGATQTDLKNHLSEYDTMLGKNENYASVEFTVAKEMAICNNKA
jgi:hypothetical protein